MENNMSKEDTGGPAFGLTLRDYFAAKAMQGECASQSLDCYIDPNKVNGVARKAYDIADAMLEARKK
jgi:hypothetical protein